MPVETVSCDNTPVEARTQEPKYEVTEQKTIGSKEGDTEVTTYGTTRMVRKRRLTQPPTKRF